MRWKDGRVTVEDSVAMPNAITGKTLRDRFVADISTLTLGLVRLRDSSISLGPFELIRLGRARLTQGSVQWPIRGGLLARAPGGHLRIEALYGRLVASVAAYQPMLPRALYAVTQLPVHHLWSRLYLLRARGREPSPGVPADASRRLLGAAIDVGLCIGLTAVVARGRRRLPAFLGIAAGYHVACWTTSGRTLGGAVMNQRVVSVDGSGLSVGQAALRLVSLPLAAFWRRHVQDEVAGTTVVDD